MFSRLWKHLLTKRNDEDPNLPISPPFPRINRLTELPLKVADLGSNHRFSGQIRALFQLNMIMLSIGEWMLARRKPDEIGRRVLFLRGV